MPADGNSLPRKEGLRHVPLGRLKVRLHQRRHRAEGVWPLVARTGW